MKAVQINKYGGVEVLEIKTETPKPSVTPGHVLVKIMAVSINPFDWKIREGLTKSYLQIEFPSTVGGDFAGVISDPGVSNFKAGDEVYGQAGVYSNGSGSFAEFALADVNKIASKPSNVNFEDAASLPLAGQSALQAIRDDIGLKPSQKILIHGGAGGIGSLAIQIAKAIGAYVITTASSDDLDYVKSLGADEAIDYKSEDFSTKVNNVDAVFDTVGGETTNKSFEVIKNGGVLASMAGEPDQDLAKKFEVKTVGVNTNGITEKLDSLKKLVEAGKVKPQVAKVFGLDDVKESFTYQETGHHRGKVVLKIAD